MSFPDEQDDGNRRRPAAPPQPERASEKQKNEKKRAPSAEVGNALRAAYQRAMNEEIPPEMLDLLGKLG